jgi:hypothetical protein
MKTIGWWTGLCGPKPADERTALPGAELPELMRAGSGSSRFHEPQHRRMLLMKVLK